MALPAIGDGEQIGDGNANETLNVGRSGQAVQVAGAASTLLGFHGATPVDQSPTAAALSTSAATQTSAYGFATQAQADAIAVNVNLIRACLREKGLMA